MVDQADGAGDRTAGRSPRKEGFRHRRPHSPGARPRSASRSKIAPAAPSGRMQMTAPRRPHPGHRSRPEHHRLRRARSAPRRRRRCARRAWCAARPRGSLSARLAEIHAGVADVIASLKPAAMAIEQLYSHYKHPRTAILMGHARGVICLAAAQAGIRVVHYSATQIKKMLTGNGRAPKSQMQQAIRRELALAAGARAARRGRRPGHRPVPLLSCKALSRSGRRRQSDARNGRHVTRPNRHLDHQNHRPTARTWTTTR